MWFIRSYFSMSVSLKSRLQGLTIATLLALVVAACGGGGGGGSSSNNGGGTSGGGNPPPTTTSTVYVTGAITGFGSVYVNGVRYNSDSATVHKDDISSTVNDLKVGDVITLKAEVDAQGNAVAKTIDQNTLIKGVVTAVDPVAQTITVNGQVIGIDANTVIDDSIPGATLANIQVGDRVKVNGFVSPSGPLATRIEKAAVNETESELTGIVAALDTTAKRFTIGTQVVDYSTATLTGFATTGIAAGDVVEVKGTTFLQDGALQAVKVNKEDGHHEDAKSGDDAEFEGYVTRFVSATDFDINGQKVTTTNTTTFTGGTAADLALDVKVEAEGEFDANGTLVAKKVALKPQSSMSLTAQVESVDTTASTFKALGRNFTVTASTVKRDRKNDLRLFSLTDLVVGDWVEVSAYTDAGGNLVATKLERQASGSNVELKGKATELALPLLKVAGVPVETLNTTQFEKDEVDITQADFFAQASDKVVEVEGSWNNTNLIATKAKLENEDD